MEPTVLVALALAPLVGSTLGTLGAGGSILTLPILVYIAGVPPPEAVAMSMVVVGGTSLPGAFLHHRRGHFHTKAALLFGGAGVVAAFFGAELTHLVSPRVLMLIFAAIMAAAGILMLRKKNEDSEGESRCDVVRCLLVGAGVGALTGFLGIGGGFMIVPALILLAGVDTKNAVGASLAVITVNAAAGLAGQMQQTSVDWPMTLGFTALTVGGMFAGLAVAEKVPAATLRTAFAWMVIGVAAAVGATTSFTDALPTGKSRSAVLPLVGERSIVVVRYMRADSRRVYGSAASARGVVAGRLGVQPRLGDRAASALWGLPRPDASSVGLLRRLAGGPLDSGGAVRPHGGRVVLVALVPRESVAVAGPGGRGHDDRLGHRVPGSLSGLLDLRGRHAARSGSESGGVSDPADDPRARCARVHEPPMVVSST